MMSKESRFYRQKGSAIRELASRTRKLDRRRKLEEVADEYERLAGEKEAVE